MKCEVFLKNPKKTSSTQENYFHSEDEEEIVVEAPAKPKVGVASRIIKPRVRK